MSAPVVLIVLAFGALAVLVTRAIRQSTHPDEAEAWSVTDGTIESVGTAFVSAGGRGSRTVEVGNFSYKVNDEYYSGRLMISPSVSTGDRSPKELIHRKIQVQYRTQKPEKCSVSTTELEGFLLVPCNQNFGDDVDPIDLNIDKL